MIETKDLAIRDFRKFAMDDTAPNAAILLVSPFSGENQIYSLSNSAIAYDVFTFDYYFAVDYGQQTITYYNDSTLVNNTGIIVTPVFDNDTIAVGVGVPNTGEYYITQIYFEQALIYEGNSYHLPNEQQYFKYYYHFGPTNGVRHSLGKASDLGLNLADLVVVYHVVLGV
jgi:hypothetical protein